MDKQLRDKWVAALRSGEYKQTTGSLRDTDENNQHLYCCLGVLCDVIDPTKWTVSGHYIFENGTKKGGSLSAEVSCKLGLSALVVEGATIEDTLVEMNDTDRKSFDEIADFIEREVPVEDESNG